MSAAVVVEVGGLYSSSQRHATTARPGRWVARIDRHRLVADKSGLQEWVARGPARRAGWWRGAGRVTCTSQSHSAPPGPPAPPPPGPSARRRHASGEQQCTMLHNDTMSGFCPARDPSKRATACPRPRRPRLRRLRAAAPPSPPSPGNPLHCPFVRLNRVRSANACGLGTHPPTLIVGHHRRPLAAATTLRSTPMAHGPRPTAPSRPASLAPVPSTRTRAAGP